ncbi:proton channel OtopLc-like [Chelonus insularis]|uniref:proton channel OtopLc-like n=1 Tax=Chelonus insularis TaxID=460826 RepID=UPI00158DD7A5|nr:proton channel OtopLc-like [Chelonus insularis]
MVAKLAAFLLGAVVIDSDNQNKSSSLSCNALSLLPESNIRDRPGWINSAIKESNYTVFDEKYETPTDGDKLKKGSIAINAVRVAEVEPLDEPLYSVVEKPKFTEKNKKLQDQSKSSFNWEQTKVSKWLAVYPKIVEETSTMDRNMQPEKVENSWNDPVSVPRGIVGVVGPYSKIYKNSAKECEYVNDMDDYTGDDMMSTVVDSISQVGTFQRNKDVDEVIKQEIHQRPKWTIHLLDDNEKKLEEFDEREDNPSHCEENKLPGYSIKDENNCYEEKANNEPHDKDSLNETGSTAGGVTAEGNQPESSNRNERVRNGSSEPEVTATSEKPISTSVPPRSLVSRILARTKSPDDLLDHSEPYSQLWIVLSNVYGELIIILMLALCLAEVIDTPVPLLSLQSVFLMYLYVGSIVVIISIYLWVLVDSCSSLSSRDDIEIGGVSSSLTRFGSLKRAHISRTKTAPTSFYIRIGALLFGLATLVFNGLEMAMHSMMQGSECLNDIVFVHPVLHGMFTFLQMHFLFVNSQVLVERFGLAARFGFIHLAATNIAVWARLIIWDSAQEWTYFIHLSNQKENELLSSSLHQQESNPESTTVIRVTRDTIESSTEYLRKYQPISDEKIAQIITLQECFNTNTLGQLWTSSISFLYPFIVQFSLIAAAVTFVMGQNVGRNRFSHKQKFHSVKDFAAGHPKVGCDGASKGLFLGILSMTAGIVVILIFLVVREDENFPPATLSWLTCGTLIGILALSTIMTISGLIQVKQMSVVSRSLSSLDNILSNVALFGVQLHSIFTAVVCACFLATVDTSNELDTRGRHVMLLTASLLQLIQCFAQSTLIAEASKRSCITRCQIMTKPARQVVTFLLFSNAVLWAFDTVVTQNWISQELQLRFFGVLAWGIVSRICVPLLVFYRFHSCVLLLEIWTKCYKNLRIDLPLN